MSDMPDEIWLDGFPTEMRNLCGKFAVCLTEDSLLTKYVRADLSLAPDVGAIAERLKKKIAIDGAAAHPQKIMGWNAALDALVSAIRQELSNEGEKK